MSTELVFVPQQSNPPAIVQDQEGNPVMMINDVEVPVVDDLIDMYVVQPGHVRKNKDLAKHIGEFAYKNAALNDVFLTEITVVPIGVIGRGRRLYPPYDSGESGLLCYSNNNLAPAKKVTSPFALACGHTEEKNNKTIYVPTCEKAIWVDGKKPDCGDVVSVALFDLGLKAPIRFQFSGTSISAWNGFLKQNSSAKNIARLRGRPLKDFVAVMKVVNEGTYVKLTFDFVEMPELNAGGYRDLLSHYLESLVKPRWAKDAIDEPEEKVVEATPMEVLPEEGMDSKSAAEVAPASQPFAI